MIEQLVIYNAIVLPVSEVEALIQGRMIVAIPSRFLHIGETFSLYPLGVSTNTTVIKAWARCEFCERIYKREEFDILSELTIWKQERFEEILQKRPHFFLAYLRVYHLSQPYEIAAIPNIQDKLGKFVGLPNISASEAKPVLSDQVFLQRKQQLEKRQPPLHPELEKLQTALSQIANNNPAAQQLENEIKVFLGWSNAPIINTIDSDLAWIKNIANVGNSSDGNEFERLVRKSLIKLGFSSSNTNPKANLDPNKLGGPGGLDFYCEYPYRVVGECKATKTETVHDGTAAQIVKLGYKHLQQEYNNCIKIIMAAGELIKHTELTAKGNQMNVIRPETLQRLVELKAKHPGSIDLLNLKPYLEKEPFGEASNDKINEYIDKIEKEIKLRSYIIQLVKNYLQNSGIESAGVENLDGAYFGSNPPQPLKPGEMYEILIELSSPLTGYLGRIKSSDRKNDKFYYLRDLPIN